MGGDAAFAIFDTAVGRCAIAWRGDAVIAFALPGKDDDTTRAGLRAGGADAIESAPPEWVAAVIADVQALLEGQDVDLTHVRVDLSGVPNYERSIYRHLRQVKRGETVTYGELAERTGNANAARAVGMAMGRNPIPVIIPCHRVLAGSGRSGGFSAPGGTDTKFRILQIERAKRANEQSLLFDDLPLAVAPKRWRRDLA